MVCLLFPQLVLIRDPECDLLGDMPGSPPDLDRLPPEDLKKLLVEALEERARLEAETAALLKERARLISRRQT